MVEPSPRLKALKEKLAAREGKKEFTENVKALKAEIARIESTTSVVTSGTAEPE